jgi:hypothetical protein
MDIRITAYSLIRNNQIFLNGRMVFENREAGHFGEFIRSAYKYAELSYPKFYKMDDLCKLGLMAAEFALKESGALTRFEKDEIGLVFQNASATKNTDREFQTTIDDRANYFPSPAVFVYTLPNIMIGEICIRHKLFGENALFIGQEFKPEALCEYTDMLFRQNRIKALLAGWVELNGGNADAYVYFAEPAQETNVSTASRHDPENLRSQYNNPFSK